MTELDVMTDILGEAVERLAKDHDKKAREDVGGIPGCNFDADTAATLRAQAERIKDLEAERDAFRAVLEGAEYGDVDGIGKADPDIARLLGRQVMKLTKIKLSEARNDALREAIKASKEPIAKIVYDSWYKKDRPVTSHGYQRVQEAVEAAISALFEGGKP